jgi:hypothetical protein
MKKEMDLYNDYLLICFDQVTASSRSSLLDDFLLHDKIARMLSRYEFSSKDLWKEVKSLVRSCESADVCLIFDGTIFYDLKIPVRIRTGIEADIVALCILMENIKSGWDSTALVTSR